MDIVAYKEKYRNAVSDLLVELQSHLMKADTEQVQILTPDYRKHYIDYVLNSVNSFNGKFYLALEKEVVIGAAAGIIEPKDKEDALCTRCPIRGVVTELIVKQNCRGNGVGRALFMALEQYFVKMNCEFVSVNVFAPNTSAVSFYQKMGCKNRNTEMIKRISGAPQQRFTYSPATLQELEALWEKNIAESRNKVQWKNWKRQFIEDNQRGKALTFAVCNSDIPIGEGTLLFSPDCNAINGRKILADNKTTANINALRIQKAYEGKGHISKLVKEMENYALNNGCSYLTIGVEASEARTLAIYLHWGYTEFVMSEMDNGALVLYYRKLLR